MPGSNARARKVTDTAFTPSGSTATAGVYARTATNGAFGSVKNAYSNPSTNIWNTTPPVPTAPTYRNVRTGTFPNLNNSIWVDWTSDTSGVIASFDIFAKIGSGAYTHVANLSAATREYNYGAISADTTYSFYVRSNGIGGLTRTSTETSVSLGTPSTVGTLSTSKTTTSATASWTVPAGTYQKFHVYASTTYLGEVLATSTGTSYSFTRSGLAQNVAYNFRVYAQNYNQHWSTFSEVNITTDTLTIPSISWSDSSATKYSAWSITWSGTAGITYQPQYYKTSWQNNGATQSGSGSKTSATQDVGYSSTLYMRLYVTDAYGASGYTGQIQVTAGRPLLQESSWKTGASTLYEYSVDANGPGWGNLDALSFVCNSTQDYYFDTVLPGSSASSVSAYSLQSPSKELTRTDRRCRIKAPDTGTYRDTSFDGRTAPYTSYQGVTAGWHTSAGASDVTYNFGVADETYWYINGANRYANVSNGTIDNWNTGANTRFILRVQATPRNYTTTTVETQVNSTYA